MRFLPDPKYNELPCSYVGTGCAYEDYYGKQFNVPMIENLKNGWSTLNNTDKYVRSLLPVTRKVYYKRDERFTLNDFLKSNDKKCLVCVYGHFIYVNKGDYWSFFPNENDKIVCIWYLK